ncbi:FAD/NAD(P)-binding domain-containing protein [Rhizodiscina lignyota]|uniref:FAD/NAD(P)-binding domain-containing protein n=1 Tax=Rhizodiscina lignyota TaxID=1504668 RepID=A0A9P4I9V8_9PEZI|nr:FAD/NAD(P)-binding domain-containing protein [Rhizodiscina lignyota]
MENPQTTDVLICGCGPTGALLSTLLGRYGVPNIVLERELEITQDARGAGLDEDGIRYLQACGIYDKVFTDIGHCMGNLFFLSGAHHDLHRKPMMKMTYSTTEGGTGHPGFIFHKQPRIEKHLRAKMAASGFSELRVGATVCSIREDDDWVYATYSDPEGKEHHVRSKFFVGCDGKTGFTRKMYLEPRGVSLDRAHKVTYDEVWVAMNLKLSLPTPQSHPDFPLWAKGYTPQEVYDLFFPFNFRFLCNPSRAAVCGRLGRPDDRLWRFEFVILPGEDGAEMASVESIRRVVYPYLKHPGRRYGLSKDVSYPEDCIEVLRSRPFLFNARSCNKWALDRVILAGDAAHVFPPFGGQGIASGFRDAISLAWRLVLATQQASSNGQPPDFRRLFLGWYSERKQQLDDSLAATVENGNYVTATDPLQIFIRDWSLWFMQLIPSWRHWLELGGRRDGMTKYRWEADKDMVFLPELSGGVNCPQVYCRQISKDARVQFTDDVIFAHDKAALFQVLVLLPDIHQLDEVTEALKGIEDVSSCILRANEATIIIQSTTTLPYHEADVAVYRLASGEEFANDEFLCGGRPKPEGYDPHRISKEVSGRRYVILRPDRFVFAACNTKDELHAAAKQLALLAI